MHAYIEMQLSTISSHIHPALESIVRPFSLLWGSAPTRISKMFQLNHEYWKSLPGPRLLNLIIAVSALAISYEGMSQGVMGAVNVAPEYGVSVRGLRTKPETCR